MGAHLSRRLFLTTIAGPPGLAIPDNLSGQQAMSPIGLAAWFKQGGGCRSLP
jgi:hypothetical protein